MKILPIVICAIVIIFIECTKEFSCESCLGWPIVPSRDSTINDTVAVPPRTVPNELLARCSVYFNDESEVRKVYVETTTKYHPQTFKIFDSIKLDGRKLYDTVFNLKNYLDMGRFVIGDTFVFRTDVRWKLQAATFENLDSLIY